MAVGALLAVGCTATTAVVTCRPGEQTAVMESLYFGTTTPTGRVNAEDWQRFLAEVITPHFPEGLTAWAAAGQWQDSSGELLKEDSYVLHVIHADALKYEAAIREVVETYKSRFAQEAVLRVRTATCISF